MKLFTIESEINNITVHPTAKAAKAVAGAEAESSRSRCNPGWGRHRTCYIWAFELSGIACRYWFFRTISAFEPTVKSREAQDFSGRKFIAARDRLFCPR